MRIILLALLASLASFYSLSYTDNSGGTVSLSQYAGKRVLLVNVASGSSRAGQLAELQQLQQQYGDSLVIIAFPSNSFAHEPLADTAITALCLSQYGATFHIAQKAPVSGPQQQPVYAWLTQQSENGEIDSPVLNDFQKFLIDRQGHLAAVFSPTVSPTDPRLIAAIDRN